jgi:hypothetical protein
MSIEGLLSIRGDASGAVAELRKISEGLGQVREKGMRAGSGIATAIGAIGGALMKFNFVVAGISTAFEVLKAGAAVAKAIWDKWGISPSVKREIAWLEQQSGRRNTPAPAELTSASPEVSQSKRTGSRRRQHRGCRPVVLVPAHRVWASSARRTFRSTTP